MNVARIRGGVGAFFSDYAILTWDSQIARRHHVGTFQEAGCAGNNRADLAGSFDMDNEPSRRVPRQRGN